MSKKFDDILNECLNRMAAGEDLEQCLQDYPDLSEELRPLLETALTVKSSANLAQPKQEFRELTRQQFLAEVRAKAEAQRQPKWYSVLEWQHRWAMATVAVLLVIFVGGGTTVAASSNAMPDDLLYPVKLAVEDVRMTFTGSDVKKAELQAEFADRRANEIAKMAEEGKWSKVEATAERLSSHLEKIVDVAAEKRVAGELDREDIAKLMTTMVHYASDHPLIFRKAVEQMPAEEKAVIVKVFQAAKMQYAEAIEDLNIAIRENTGQSAMVSAGTTTELDDIVRMIVDGKWVVGDQVVNIDDSTLSDVTPNIGSAARIEAQVQSNGSLVAKNVRVLPTSYAVSEVDGTVTEPVSLEPYPKPSVNVTIRPSVTPSITVSPETDTEPVVIIDDAPAITAIQTPTEVSNVPDVRTFTGVIRKITNTEWTVGFRTVIVNEDTVMRGEPGIGQSARVWLSVQPDGSLLAHTVWVQKSESVDVPDEPDSGEVEDSSGNTNVVPSTGVLDSSQSSGESEDNSNSMTGR